MKNVLVQYLWIFSITAGLLTVALLLLPEKKLTEKEKELERLATEKEWEEVDKDTNK